jgi:hypothetical protein
VRSSVTEIILWWVHSILVLMLFVMTSVIDHL